VSVVFEDGPSREESDVPRRVSAAEPSFSARLAGTGLRDCFDFWRDRRMGRRPPLKRAIDPVDMPARILPNLFLYEAIGDRFHCRLAGTEIGAAFHRDPTGHYLDELVVPAAVSSRTRLFRGVLERERPVVYGGHLAEGPKKWMQFIRLLLPVSKTGERADIVFGMIVFPYIDPRKMGNPPERPMHDFEAWATAEEL